MNKRSQAGFSVPHLLLGLVAVAIIGFAGWRVYQAQKDTNKSLDNAGNASEVVKQEEKAEEATKAFSPSNTKEKFQVMHPASWAVSEQPAQQDSTTDFPIGQVVFTTAANAKLTITYNYGGKGGGNCEPLTTDTPHNPANKCSTLEYLKLDKINEDAATKAAFSKKHTGDLYVGHTKYTSGKADSGKTSYNICLTAKYEESPQDLLVTGRPILGGTICQVPYSVLYYTITVSGVDNTSPVFFDNPDIQAFEKVLKTFKIL